MRRRGWLSTSRTRLVRSGRRHEGQVRVAEPNRRWASDITGIRAWDRRKGRLAIMIDCADRMVLTWRFATRITAEDLARCCGKRYSGGLGRCEPTRRGSSSSATTGRNTRRIGSGRSCGPGDSSPATCPGGVRSRTGWPRPSSTASNGMTCIRRASKRWKRWAASAGWLEHDNREAPHSALDMQSPAECYAAWFVTNKQQPLQN